MTSLSPQQLWQQTSIYTYRDVEGEVVCVTGEMVGLKDAVMISRSRLSLASNLIVSNLNEGDPCLLKVKVA